MLTLNESQRIAAEYDGPEDGILVLAGAGCGKTRTMIARAIFLLGEKEIRPERLAMLTFTRRAAREINERLDLELPGRHNGVFVGTIHRFCLNIIHRFAGEFDIEEVKIMDRNDEDIALRRIRNELLKARGYNIKDTGILPKEGAIASVFSYVRNTCSTLEKYYEIESCDEAETLPMMELALLEYTKYKKEHQYLDFDDILTVVAEKLCENEKLRQRVQWMFEYILVDEMQDTSPVQWKILRALYPKVKLFCVGDDAQSIYGFRGADFESVHHFCDKLPNSTTLWLTENYRSNQQILDVANVLLNDSSLRYNRNLVAHNGDSKVLPIFLKYYDENEEAISLVNLIANKMAYGTPAKEILVLMRSTINGRRLEYELTRYGIPFKVVGGHSLMDSAHVKDTFSAIEALTDPKNEIAWLRFITILPKIGEKTAERMYKNASQNATDAHSMLANMAQLLKDKAPDAANFVGTQFDVDERPAEMLVKIIDFYDETGIMSKKYDKWSERKKDLNALVEVAERYDNVGDFLEAFKIDEEAEVAEDDDSDEITLSTVHGAKGTEAEVVIVMHVQEGNYPHYRCKTDTEIEEERRVLYVAMTRAKKELYLTYCDSTRTGFSQPSTFLSVNMLDLLRMPKR